MLDRKNRKEEREERGGRESEKYTAMQDREIERERESEIERETKRREGGRERERVSEWRMRVLDRVRAIREIEEERDGERKEIE